MYRKIIDMSLALLIAGPTLKISETTASKQNKMFEKNSLFKGLNLIKESVNKIYEENTLIFDKVKSKQVAFFTLSRNFK